MPSSASRPKEHVSCSSSHVHFPHVHTLSNPTLSLLTTVMLCHGCALLHILWAFDHCQQPGSSSRVNGARWLMDFTIHYMHHSLNTVLPLARMLCCPYIDSHSLQHVITIIGSLWKDPPQSSLVSPQ